jgi:hypothetical protein
MGGEMATREVTLLEACLAEYEKLSSRIGTLVEGGVLVEKLPGIPWAHIGVTPDRVMLILPPEGAAQMVQYDLEHIRIIPLCGFNAQYETGVRAESVTIVETKSREGWLVNAFFELVAMLFETGVEQNPESIRGLLADLVNLFRALTQPALKSLIGLWGELFVIDQSKSVSDLVAAWHSTLNDKFDFSSGHERVEVKTTTGTRVHNFSHAQLVMPKGVRVTIASLILTHSTDGLTCTDLARRILKKLPPGPHSRKFIELVVRTLGEDWRKQGGESFDAEQAQLSLRFFDAIDIPRVLEPIPREVSGVKYQSDLQAVPELAASKLKPRDTLTELVIK